MTAPAPVPDEVVGWLLEGDPAVRWQVLRDLLDAPEDVWRAERARVATEGWGARLLALQDDDGLWAGGAFFPSGFTRRQWEDEGQPWTATAWAVHDLRDLGLDPASDAARRTVRLVGANARWDEGDQPFWDGEVEECINGRTLADGCWFGVDMSALAERLAGEVQPDGGWNCERAEGSVRSSFDSTINVLEGLAAFEAATGGTAATRAARRSGEEFLLARGLFRRASTGEPADPSYLLLHHPARFHHDVLRGLDHFRVAAALDRAAPDGASHAVPDPRPDPRLAGAVDVLRGKRRPDGRWALERELRGRTWFGVEDGVGEPSRWLTMQALRVLRWWDAATA
ncbi:squalene cyclase [Luteimicrobium subarcticum]|uniref:Squalene cyclase n=1 Tax=Luteimicrobium subarcticum TaxID=620910 RepID=A0A2M8W1C4_9MICO|nr:squalene cyclase [Luteimicrobium subarcticum]PJI84710.1 hypothetical protein CLV34_3165 [Luteimicrobium subarcticum]